MSIKLALSLLHPSIQVGSHWSSDVCFKHLTIQEEERSNVDEEVVFVEEVALLDADKECVTDNHYKCLTCNVNFDEKLHVHCSNCRYYCERCCRYLGSKSNMIIHENHHRMGNAAKFTYKCDKCFVEFDNRQHLEFHMKLHF